MFDHLSRTWLLANHSYSVRDLYFLCLWLDIVNVELLSKDVSSLGCPINSSILKNVSSLES